MIDTMTIALFVLALISLVVASVAIGWLSLVSKHLSVLGKRVLESQDIGRVIQAADKAASFESRMTGCEGRADESQSQLAEHETKLSELIAKQEAAGQMMDRHTADLAKASEKMASFELRFGEFENKVGEKLNQLLELETEVNELASRLKSVEGMVNNNRSGLAEADQSIKALTDKIESLEKFQTTTEKTHSLIQAAFTDMRESMSPDEGQGIISEIPEPEGTSQGPGDGQEEVEDQKTSGTYRLDI